MRLSVLVPTYNEEHTLPTFLSVARTWQHDCELIFIDASSADKTRELLASYCCIESPKGRGQQLACGVEASTGDAILVLHADSKFSRAAFDQVVRTLEEGAAWGCCTLRFSPTASELVHPSALRRVLLGVARRVGQFWSNARVVLWGIPFGDQAMFFRREVLEAVGGMPALPLMEDYELSRRLRRVCRPRRLPAQVVTSYRRFEQHPLVTMLSMFALRRQYRRGACASELARAYDSEGVSHEN